MKEEEKRRRKEFEELKKIEKAARRKRDESALMKYHRDYSLFFACETDRYEPLTKQQEQIIDNHKAKYKKLYISDLQEIVPGCARLEPAEIDTGNNNPVFIFPKCPRQRRPQQERNCKK